jgi:predicted PurR-regulated permease PerM
MNQKIFNERLRQVFFFLLILIIGILLAVELGAFLPGLLGGVTLFILSRSYYYKLVNHKKWPKGITALLFIIIFLVILAIPIYLSINLLAPKIHGITQSQDKIMEGIKLVGDKIKERTGFTILTAENAKWITSRITSFIPGVINSTASVLTNLLMMFFLLYYLLVSGKDIEKHLSRIIPLKASNISILAAETKMMIKANALGIPVICIIQGSFAALGYWIFGVESWALWGFLTGVFAFFPLVGTMIIWVPLVLLMYAQGLNWQATALLFYSLLVTGNVDYIARLGLMKKMGNVHPVVTVLGVIVGLKLFGFIGLIFGPLLISYLIILVKIYINEFGGEKFIEEIDELKVVTKEE